MMLMRGGDDSNSNNNNKARYGKAAPSMGKQPHTAHIAQACDSHAAACEQGYESVKGMTASDADAGDDDSMCQAQPVPSHLCIWAAP